MGAERLQRLSSCGSVWARGLSVFAGIGAAAVAATCGGQVRVDDDGSRGGGGEGGAGAQQGSSVSVGPGSVGPGSVGPSSVGPSVASSTTGDVGAGGASGCFSCSAYLNECVVSEAPECATWDLCDGESVELFNVLADCVCTACAVECVNTCAGAQGDPECEPCQQGAIGGVCSGAFTDCASDF
jgi:hypothetical protein